MINLYRIYTTFWFRTRREIFLILAVIFIAYAAVVSIVNIVLIIIYLVKNSKLNKKLRSLFSLTRNKLDKTFLKSLIRYNKKEFNALNSTQKAIDYEELFEFTVAYVHQLNGNINELSNQTKHFVIVQRFLPKVYLLDEVQLRKFYKSKEKFFLKINLNQDSYEKITQMMLQDKTSIEMIKSGRKLKRVAA
jgi:hypothetical protein